MKKLLVLVLSVALVGLFSVPESHAKRFGGGKSFGKSFKYSRQAKPQRPAQQNNAAGAANTRQANGAAAPRRGGFMGPLAGLAAGGLLAAMFFGGAFEGFQMFDFLIIALLAFLGFRLLRFFAASRSPQPAYSSGGSSPVSSKPVGSTQQRSSVAQSSRRGTFDIPKIGSGLEAEPLAVQPEWFNELTFMAEAESHFREVQVAWDRGDMASIKEYVTAEMYTSVSALSLEPSDKQNTDVVELSSQLLDLLQDGDDVVAAILFSGLISEDGEPASEFAETWHVRHPKATEEGAWLIDGIRQYAD